MKCSKCEKDTKPYGFATYRKRDGSVGRRGVCKVCRGAYAKENFKELQKWRKDYNAKNRSERGKQALLRRNRAREYLNKIKEQTPCADCGKHFPAVAMDFDHVRGKNKPVSGMAAQGYRIELIAEEIKLCEVVCACCHRIRTQKRNQNHSKRRTLLKPDFC